MSTVKTRSGNRNKRPQRTGKKARHAPGRNRKGTPEKSFPVFPVAIGVVVAVFAAAIFLTRQDGAAPESSGLQETASVEIDGAGLPPVADSGADESIGLPAPSIVGETFDGEAVQVPAAGRPKVVIFLAHWCNFCQAEVPVIQEWIDQNGAPAGVDMYSVATATNESQPNYPPSSWLERENWTVPVLLDDAAQSAAGAYGVGGYPFFAFVDADGNVSSRTSGAIPIEDFERHLSAIVP